MSGLSNFIARKQSKKMNGEWDEKISLKSIDELHFLCQHPEKLSFMCVYVGGVTFDTKNIESNK